MSENSNNWRPFVREEFFNDKDQTPNNTDDSEVADKDFPNLAEEVESNAIAAIPEEELGDLPESMRIIDERTRMSSEELEAALLSVDRYDDIYIKKYLDNEGSAEELAFEWAERVYQDIFPDKWPDRWPTNLRDKSAFDKLVSLYTNYLNSFQKQSVATNKQTNIESADSTKVNLPAFETIDLSSSNPKTPKSYRGSDWMRDASPTEVINLTSKPDLPNQPEPVDPIEVDLTSENMPDAITDNPSAEPANQSNEGAVDINLEKRVSELYPVIRAIAHGFRMNVSNVRSSTPEILDRIDAIKHKAQEMSQRANQVTIEEYDSLYQELISFLDWVRLRFTGWQPDKNLLNKLTFLQIDKN